LKALNLADHIIVEVPNVPQANKAAKSENKGHIPDGRFGLFTFFAE